MTRRGAPRRDTRDSHVHGAPAAQPTHSNVRSVRVGSTRLPLLRVGRASVNIT